MQKFFSNKSFSIVTLIFVMSLSVMLFAPKAHAAESYRIQWAGQASADGFQVERKDGTCASAAAWNIIANVGATTTAFVDGPIGNGATVCYRVGAVQNSPALIEYGNTVQVTVPGIFGPVITVTIEP